jgi:MoxR-like ATPase
MSQQTVDVTRFQELAHGLRDSIQRVIVGKSSAIDLAIIAVVCKGHVLVEDVPGIGKTTMAKALAQSLGCTFNRIQFTPDLMPTDVLGVNFYNQKSGDFEFRAGPIFSQVILADEINRATPRTQSALLEAMAERQVTVDNATVQLPTPFLVIATQNPIELEGTFPLPEAQLDRFSLRLKLGYPEESEEDQMLSRFHSSEPLANLHAVVTREEVIAFQAQVGDVYFDPVLRNYLVQLVQATRKHSDVELGASPRASIGLYRCSQALAAIRGRQYVSPDDIKTLAPYALAHRVILKSQARLRERTSEAVVHELLARVPVPV